MITGKTLDPEKVFLKQILDKRKMKNLAPFAPLYRLTCTHRVHVVGVGGGGFRWVQLVTCSLAPAATRG